MTLKKKFGLALLFVFGVLGLFGTASTSALKADWGIASTYDIAENGEMSVQHIVSVVNNDGAATPGTMRFSVFGTDIKSIEGESQDSTGRTTATFDKEKNQIVVKLEDASGVGRKWSYLVRYKSNVLDSLGDVNVIQIDPLEIKGAKINSHKATVSLDLGLGFAVTRGQEPSSTRVGIGSQILNYSNKSGLIDEGLTFFFGEKSQVSATFETTLKNESSWWQTHRIVLPPDTNQQRVIIDSIDPLPTKMRLDPDGNVIAEYSLSPKRSITVKATARIGLNNLTYALESKDTLTSIDPILKQRYTDASDVWVPNSLELKVAEDDTVAEIAHKALTAASKTIPDEFNPSEFNNKDRSGTLSLADKLVGELRGRGIPSRVVVGRAMGDGAKLFESPMNHAWAEAYIPGSGWITLDPYFESNARGFGSADILHVGFALWGIEDDFPPVDLSAWSFQYQEGDFPEIIESIPEVKVTKSVLFPGVSMRNISVIMPAGQIVDGVAVRVGESAEDVIELGSLAPFQTATIRNLQFGGSAFSTESFQPGIITLGEFAEAGKAGTSSMTFTPLIILVVTIVVVSLVTLFVRRRMRGEKHANTKDSFIMHEENSGEDIESENLLPDEDDEDRPQEDYDEIQEEYEDESIEAPAPPVRPKSQLRPAAHRQSTESISSPAPRAPTPNQRRSNRRPITGYKTPRQVSDNGDIISSREQPRSTKPPRRIQG